MNGCGGKEKGSGGSGCPIAAFCIMAKKAAGSWGGQAAVARSVDVFTRAHNPVRIHSYLEDTEAAGRFDCTSYG